MNTLPLGERMNKQILYISLILSLIFSLTLGNQVVMADSSDNQIVLADCEGLQAWEKLMCEYKNVDKLNWRFKNGEIHRLCVALRVGFNYYNVRLRLEDIKKTHGFTNEGLIQHVMVDSYCKNGEVVQSVAAFAMFNDLNDFKVLEEYGFNDTYKIDGGDGIKKIPSQIAKEQIRNYIKKPIIRETLSYIRRVFKGSK
jgi:hypothetical protein